VKRMLACAILQRPCDEQPHRAPHERDQEDPADELRERELPAEEDPHDDAELEDEVCRRELECHCGREARALLEQRFRDRDGRVAAGGRGGAEACREECLARAAPTERTFHPRAWNPRLDDAREEEAEDQGPAHLPPPPHPPPTRRGPDAPPPQRPPPHRGWGRPGGGGEGARPPPPPAAAPDPDAARDRLYGLPLDEFTAARNELATRLRKAGQAEAA